MQDYYDSYDMTEPITRKSLLRYSMEGGVWLGLYLAIRFVFTVMSLYSTLSNILALALFVGTPFVLYRIMMRYHRDCGYTSFFSLQWMLGIMLFFFASLISCIPEYVFYEYINPQYVSEVLDRTFVMLDEMGMLQESTSLAEMRTALAEVGSPSAAEMVLQSIWSNVFFGSLLSIVVAPFVTRKRQ